MIKSPSIFHNGADLLKEIDNDKPYEPIDN